MGNRTCKTCKNFRKCKTWLGIAHGNYIDALDSAERLEDSFKDVTVEFGVYNGLQGYGLWGYGTEACYTCDNQYSEFYKHGIHSGNSCELWETKNKKHKTQGLDVFKNYKCDGQLSFDINGNIR